MTSYRSNVHLAKWIEQYEALRPQYERLCTRVGALLADILSGAGVAYQVIESRAKNADSFAEKLGREGRAYSDPLSEITDLAGIRIILNYVSDVERVSQLINAEFRIDTSRSVDKRRTLATDQFGYLSVHWVVQISNTRSQLPEWRGLGDLVAEIQVRTVVQHSWAAISHALQYKREGEVPEPFRRRLVRLAGLLELADEEFEALRIEQTRLREHAAERITEGKLEAVPLDAFSVVEFVASSPLVQRVDEAARDAGMASLEDDEGPEDPLGVSQLVRAGKLAKIETIADLEHALVGLIERAPGFFIDFVQRNEARHRRVVNDPEYHVPIHGSPAHATALIVVGAMEPKPSAATLAKRLGWAREYAEDLVAVSPKHFNVSSQRTTTTDPPDRRRGRKG
jgi:putative GTP pyrophosphokinase